MDMFASVLSDQDNLSNKRLQMKLLTLALAGMLAGMKGMNES